jgi:hypothetical protein
VISDAGSPLRTLSHDGIVPESDLLPPDRTRLIGDRRPIADPGVSWGSVRRARLTPIKVLPNPRPAPFGPDESEAKDKARVRGPEVGVTPSPREVRYEEGDEFRGLFVLGSRECVRMGGSFVRGLVGSAILRALSARGDPRLDETGLRIPWARKGYGTADTFPRGPLGTS